MILLAPLLHAQTTDVWELLALVGPFAVVFGAGIMLVILPIVRTQGERYQNREHRAEVGEVSRNGHGTAKGADAKKQPAERSTAPTRLND